MGFVDRSPATSIICVLPRRSGKFRLLLILVEEDWTVGGCVHVALLRRADKEKIKYGFVNVRTATCSPHGRDLDTSCDISLKAAR